MTLQRYVWAFAGLGVAVGLLVNHEKAWEAAAIGNASLRTRITGEFGPRRREAVPDPCEEYRQILGVLVHAWGTLQSVSSKISVIQAVPNTAQKGIFA